MLQYLPKLTDWKNEVVFYLMLAVTILGEVIVLVSDTDVDSLAGLIALGPAIGGTVGRNFAYGPETAKALEAAARS